MRFKFKPFEGINYRSANAYRLLSFIKRLSSDQERFKIIAQYLRPNEKIVDVCAGPGDLQKFLPSGCQYSVVDASLEFIEKLNRKNIKTTYFDLHKDVSKLNLNADVIVMVIALCQFRFTTLSDILERFKVLAKRVVIVEEVIDRERTEAQIYQRMMHYLCQRDFYKPAQLFTHQSFKETMLRYGYEYQYVNSLYAVGFFKAEDH